MHMRLAQPKGAVGVRVHVSTAPLSVRDTGTTERVPPRTALMVPWIPAPKVVMDGGIRTSVYPISNLFAIIYVGLDARAARTRQHSVESRHTP